MKQFQAEPQEDSQTQEQIKRAIDSFKIEELRNLLNQIYKDKKLLDYLLIRMRQDLAKVITELQTNPTYDCSQLLVFIQENANQGTPNNTVFRNLFKDYEYLFKILEYTDDLNIYDLVFEIIQNYDHPYYLNRCIPRLLYLEKIFYTHINWLSFKKFNLIDYYYKDPKYQELCYEPVESLQLDLEYFEPTNLDESYDDSQQQGTNQKKLSGIIQIKKIQIIDDNSTSALILSKNLLNMQSQSLSPLIEILKYRILIKRGLQANPQQTKNIIVKLHLKSLIIMKRQLDEFVTLHEYQELYSDVIGELIKDDIFKGSKFKNIHLIENDIFILFQLETIDPILLVELLKLEQENNLTSSKQKEEFKLQLLSDVLSMRYIENQEYIQGYPLKYNPKFLSESLAQNSQLTFEILNYLIKAPINNIMFSDASINILIRKLNNQENRLLLLSEQFELALLLLNKHITRYLISFDLYFNDLITIFEFYINQAQNLQKPTQAGYVQINEAETVAIIVACIKTLSQDFELIRMNPYVEHTSSQLARKIVNSNILSSVTNILMQHCEMTTTVKYVLQLISCLANADPSLTVKIIDSNVHGILNTIINKKNIKELKFEMIKNILVFYANICRQELYSDKAKGIINDLLKYYLIKQIQNQNK